MEGLIALDAVERADIFVITLHVNLKVPLLRVESTTTFHCALEYFSFF